MNLFTAGAELLGNVGFRVVKNSAKVILGGGQAVVGFVSEDEELIEQGLKNAGRGVFGLTVNAVANNVIGDDETDDYEDIDIV